MFARNRSSQNDYTKLTAELARKADEWERLAAQARDRNDGDHAALRECRPYPDGFWAGVAHGLETAAQELHTLIEATAPSAR